jgi:hypothetical protein
MLLQGPSADWPRPAPERPARERAVEHRPRHHVVAHGLALVGVIAAGLFQSHVLVGLAVPVDIAGALHDDGGRVDRQRAKRLPLQHMQHRAAEPGLMALQELQCRPHAAHAEGLAAPLDGARRPHSVPGIAAGLTQVHREVRPEHAQRTEFTADPTLQHGLAGPEVIWPGLAGIKAASTMPVRSRVRASSAPRRRDACGTRAQGMPGSTTGS